MKKSILFAVIITVFLISCKKEQAISDNPSILKSSGIQYNNIKLEQGLLYFGDMNVFKTTLSYLETATLDWDSSFVFQNSSLSIDSLNSYEEYIAFDCEKPLTDFEDYYSFSSLRKKINSDEELWLDNEILVDSLDPDNHFIIENVVRCILNEDSEIKIGDSIYKLVENGYFIVTNGSFITLNILKNNIENYDTISNVVFIGDENLKGTNCLSNKRKEGKQENSDGDRRIKWVVSHSTYPWSSKIALAKTKNYKKKRRRWKKYRTACYAMVYGDIGSDGDCFTEVDFNPDGDDNARVAKKVKHRIHVATNTKSGWIDGKHSGAGGVTTDSSLTW